eukprot:252585-Rhodomonas_salina.1
MEVDIISIGSILVPILVTSGGATYYLAGKLGALEGSQKTTSTKIEALEKKMDDGQKALDTKIDTKIKSLRKDDLKEIKDDVKACYKSVNNLRESVARQSGEMTALRMLSQPEALQ